MSEFIHGAVYKDNCPACGAVNFYAEGDPEDITGLDTDGMECWKCRHQWLFDIAIDFGVLTVEDGNIAMGLESPTEKAGK